MTRFLPGLKLNQIYYEEAVRPILEAEFPGLVHAAARIGSGSEVLGYDDLTSTDHDWGPHFQLFLREIDFEAMNRLLAETLGRLLPQTVRGFSTHFGRANEEGTRFMEEAKGGRIAHRIEIVTIRAFFREYLGYDPVREPPVVQWLLFPQHLLLGATAGQVYADHDGELSAVRRRLSYYPWDVWLYLLACQWVRIGQEEPFIGRTGQVGDELGSRLIVGRVVHDIMSLCFLMERRYAPYPKWFGTAFARLKCAKRLLPLLQSVLAAETWQTRENALVKAWEQVTQMHNDLAITDPLPPNVSYFHGRPFKVISADRFVEAIKDQIHDEDVRSIQTNIGGIDQFSHSTDLRAYPNLHGRLNGLYEASEDFLPCDRT